ncbi:MAG: Gfo/Idh/MocA family protein [Planctomycetaceae bacterium]
MTNRQDRREFLKSSAAGAAVAGTMPFWFSTESDAALQAKSPNERPVLGCIGTGSRWNAVGPNAMQFSDCVAVCDADANHAGRAKARVKGIQGRKGKKTKIALHEDYRRILDRGDVDVVTVVTPDHWHSKIAIEAMQAGKDVYCEKPLTLTIEEGKQIVKVLKKTKRVFQVGTQQRSEMGQRFLTAVGLLRDGRIGDVKRAVVAIGGAPTSGPIPKAAVPKGLNWDLWQGQTPKVDYRYKRVGRRAVTRCHYEFRWWYEYSGGKMTDWGAHHVDIAQWGLDQLGDGQGPVEIVPVSSKHPVELKDGMPTKDDRYNTATQFRILCKFANGAVIDLRHSAANDPSQKFGNGIMFEGTKGRFLVHRGKIAGAPVEALKTDPLPEGLLKKIYKGKTVGGRNAHMRNFFDCLKTREQPISDVFSHHRALTTCHLANIAIRLNRTLKWDPKTEQIIGDKQARQMQGREQRKGYEIKV